MSPTRVERIAIAALLVFLALACGGGEQEFTILHFNDYHGQVSPLRAKAGEPVGGLARLAALAGSVAERERRAGRPTLLLFAGDAFTGTAISSMYQGEPDFRAFSKMGLSALVPGNHDWDFGAGIFSARCGSLKVPAVCANIQAQPPAPAFLRPSVTLMAGEVRVGIIGVTRSDTPAITRPGATEGYRFGSAPEAVARVLRSRGPSAWDFVVVLSHCGIEEDRAIARRNPSVGLIVGGHDHIALVAPCAEAGVSIVQAGDRGKYLGTVRVALKGEERAAVAASLLPVTPDLPVDAGIAHMLLPYIEKEEEALGAPLADLSESLPGPASRERETILGNLITDAMREASKADIAIINGGALRGDLPRGVVTGRELFEAYPYPDTLWTVSLKGSDIQALFDRCATRAGKGPWGGFLQVSGAEVSYSPNMAAEILVAGRPLEEGAEYMVACTEFLLAGGDDHAEFKRGKGARDWGMSLRDLLRSRLMDPDITLPRALDRIRFSSGANPAKRARKAA